ncbi:hypothetical protein LUX33_04440 [Actinomadura madurae]|uniref:hypothetical protein n=1 Tax=Actinomadura madurae TaxID=1993 RepID=UPI0020D21264|nr:hypothetical protein [Actinomadura madurae]MCP9947758.1 hypothetical protein [Actinomadura madurae]
MNTLNATLPSSGAPPSGGGGTTGAIRPQSPSTAPTWKSAPSGPAISAATNSRNDLPDTRRTSSPTR